MTAGLGCHPMNLSIGNHEFPTDLIILESQGLDVILGMDWLTRDMKETLTVLAKVRFCSPPRSRRESSMYPNTHRGRLR